MAVRSIASLTISFGLVAIPVKLYTATESSAALRFKWMAPNGARVRQQYVAEQPPVREQTAVIAPPSESDASANLDSITPLIAAAGGASAAKPPTGATVFDFARRPAPAATNEEDDDKQELAVGTAVERTQMLKGYEYAKGQFVLFTPSELQALQSETRETIDIVSFIPDGAVDSLYYDKAYYLAPDKRGNKPYSLLHAALRDTRSCALAKWAWRAKEYVVQIRAADEGLVLQQLLYADEVRPMSALPISLVDVSPAEMNLARQLIEQSKVDAYDPGAFVDEEKLRVLKAIESKIAGQQVVTSPHVPAADSSAVTDLMAALQASLKAKSPLVPPADERATTPRKPMRRTPVQTEPGVKAKRPARQKAS